MCRMSVRRAPLVAALLVALGLAGLTGCHAIERPRRSRDRAGIEGALRRFTDRVAAVPLSADGASPLLREFMVRRLEIQSAALVLTDETGERPHLVSMVEREAGRLHDVDPPMNLHKMEWFETARLLGRPTWTISQFDRGSLRTRTITYAVPIYRDGQFIGVAAAHVRSD